MTAIDEHNNFYENISNLSLTQVSDASAKVEINCLEMKILVNNTLKITENTNKDIMMLTYVKAMNQ